MDRKIEAVARALCKLDGRDPDGTTRQPGRIGFQRPAASVPGEDPPLWHAYRAEAERFVVVAEALAAAADPVRDGLPHPVAPVEVKRW